MRLILAVCALMSSSVAFATGPRMFQNFTNNAAGWYTAADSNSAWTVTPGTTPNGYYSNDTAPSGTAESIALYTLSSNPRNWKDNFIYSFDMYPSSGTTADQLGAIFDYTAPGSYYEVLMNVQGNVTVRRLQNGSQTWIATGSVASFSTTTTPTNYAQVQLSLLNGSLSLKVNGNDTTFYNQKPNVDVTTVGGRIGLVARNVRARFDNVNIVERIFRGNFTNDDTKQGFDIPQEPTTHCSNNGELTCYSVLSGKDTSGYSWPIQMWGNNVDPDSTDSPGAAFQYIPHIASGNPSDYLNAKTEHVMGHGGAMTDVLHQTIIKPGLTSNKTPQIPYVIHPLNTFDDQHDLYLRFWLQYPSGLDGTMPNGTQHSWWQMPFQVRTDDADTANPNPLRVSLFAANTPTHDGTHCDPSPNHPNDPPQGQWHWLIQGDDGAVDRSTNPPETPYWAQCNADPTAAIPMAQWFKVEIYFHRATSATSTGRVWVAIAGKEVLDYTVPATTPDNGMYDGRAAIDRIMLPQMYGGDYWPREQYVDDVEIWNGFPPDASPDLP